MNLQMRRYSRYALYKAQHRLSYCRETWTVIYNVFRENDLEIKTY